MPRREVDPVGRRARRLQQLLLILVQVAEVVLEQDVEWKLHLARGAGERIGHGIEKFHAIVWHTTRVSSSVGVVLLQGNYQNVDSKLVVDQIIDHRTVTKVVPARARGLSDDDQRCSLLQSEVA